MHPFLPPTKPYMTTHNLSTSARHISRAAEICSGPLDVGLGALTSVFTLVRIVSQSS